MELDKLKPRKITVDRWAGRIGGIGLGFAYLNVLWVFQRDQKAESAAIAFGITLLLSFFSLVGLADSRRTANILGVEKFRPYLHVQVENGAFFIKNFGRGIAFDIVLYTANARKEIDRLGSIPPGETLPISPEIGRLITDQGIEVFCTCQLARWWNASIGPAVSKFATTYSELKSPPDQERVL
jgi:hypothetical protein